MNKSGLDKHLVNPTLIVDRLGKITDRVYNIDSEDGESMDMVKFSIQEEVEELISQAVQESRQSLLGEIKKKVEELDKVNANEEYQVGGINSTLPDDYWMVGLEEVLNILNSKGEEETK